MKINPYLNFDGNAEEAMSFYKKIFGKEFNVLQRFEEMPPQEGLNFPDEEKNRIMHVSFPIGNNFLMASDISPAQGHSINQGNNIYISITPDSLEETKRIYNKLTEGAKKIEMELSKMFRGDYFASFADKFGIMWMINYNPKENE
jgi:PhnB protein